MSPVKTEPGSVRARPKRKAAAKGAPAKKKAAAKKKPAAKKKTPRKTAAKKAPPAELGSRFRLGTLNWRRSLVFGAKAAFIFGLVFVTITGSWMVSYLFVNPPMTPLMLIRHFQDEEDIRNRWRSYDEVSPEFILAVVAAEDQLFFKHNGFDVKQIRAAIETRLEGGRLRGGSTISQQVAKNLFLWPGRSWIRKGLEVYFTVGIEFCWPKERILEMYVNVAELGPGIYGVESAAQHYYHKSASDLNRQESALLAAVLPAPRSRSPIAPTVYLRERQAWILGQMHNLGGPVYLSAR
ncbi:MAG: monofunctional biosynthetic peptidoglycan transglycosylase [Candidatus Hydrogenedentes bacterium]|nr:monofunctional biosynthetic peptidoglycan transglycosylase [Candidatus Hydrogenedentota bacterium]